MSTPDPELSRTGGDRAARSARAATAPGSAGAEQAAEEKARADREDTELMLRFKRGDAKAFELLLARHRRGVYNFCLKMLGERTSAEDAMQEIFLRVVRSAKDWERNAKLTTWLYTIARNHCIDALRKASYRKTASLDQPLREGEEQGTTLGEQVGDDQGIAPDRGAESARMRLAIASALAGLPAEQREVFVMREHAGMPFKEIAAVVGVPENTVKSRMRYALEHLRESLRKAGITRED
ncbi:MAG: RNA polymerase sigma factor [Deltaproteobacteria bacterium]|nr:RNA polymerase sigma factor [Deltaproteobacteria bacterium]